VNVSKKHYSMSQPWGQARDLFSFWVIIFCNWYNSPAD